jgi:hypothetical protein
MGILNKLFAYKNLVDIMRLVIYMSFSPVLGGGRGSACIEWVPLTYDEPKLRGFLLSLLYARILTIHKETRSQLFWLIDELSKSNVRDEGQTGFNFNEWTIGVRGVSSNLSCQYIWPWVLVENPNLLNKPKVYKARMQTAINEQYSYFLNLKMDLGQERILTPSSFLISMNAFCQKIGRQDCYELAVFLWQINEYYKSPEKISIGHESMALKSAIIAVKKGNLVAP